MKKVKIYRMPLSRVFPATHSCRGETTGFRSKLMKALLPSMTMEDHPKIHTIRANYPLWKLRIDEVNTGKAVLVLYEWTGKPYRSRTKNLFMFGTRETYQFMIDLTKRLEYSKTFIHSEDQPLGIQEITLHDIDWSTPDIKELAFNDGLSIDDFKEWFKGYDLAGPLAIIHFTKFRY